MRKRDGACRAAVTLADQSVAAMQGAGDFDGPAPGRNQPVVKQEGNAAMAMTMTGEVVLPADKATVWAKAE